MHSELQIGTSRLMLAGENPSMGAKIERPIADQFYGGRAGGIVHPFGHHWYVATHQEDVSPEEMDRRMKAMPPRQQ